MLLAVAHRAAVTAAVAYLPSALFCPVSFDYLCSYNADNYGRRRNYYGYLPRSHQCASAGVRLFHMTMRTTAAAIRAAKMNAVHHQLPIRYMTAATR